MVRIINAVFILILIFGSCSNSTPKENKTSRKEIKPERLIDSSYIFDKQDTIIFNEIIQLSREKQWQDLEYSELLIKVGEQFLQKPYAAHTLETVGKETLVINLRGLDCTTFVETTTALALTVKENKPDFMIFCDHLINLRYRNGNIDGYPSRLHYISEWYENNKLAGLVEVIDTTSGHLPYDKHINFMSTHTESYDKLLNETFVEEIVKTEQKLNLKEQLYIPEEKLYSVENELKNGDIIAITTNIEGLDVMHMGLAYFINERLHLMHASSTNNQVEISDKPLSDMLIENKYMNGIIVARISKK